MSIKLHSIADRSYYFICTTDKYGIWSLTQMTMSDQHNGYNKFEPSGQWRVKWYKAEREGWVFRTKPMAIFQGKTHPLARMYDPAKPLPFYEFNK